MSKFWCFHCKKCLYFYAFKACIIIKIPVNLFLTWNKQLTRHVCFPVKALNLCGRIGLLVTTTTLRCVPIPSKARQRFLLCQTPNQTLRTSRVWIVQFSTWRSWIAVHSESTTFCRNTRRRSCYRKQNNKNRRGSVHRLCWLISAEFRSWLFLTFSFDERSIQKTIYVYLNLVFRIKRVIYGRVAYK